MAATPPPVIATTGRRKTAVARIQMVRGAGLVSVNGRDFEDYFTTPAMKSLALQPLQLTESAKKFDIKVNAHGGGLVGQAGALSLGPGPRPYPGRPDTATHPEKARAAPARFARKRAEEIGSTRRA